LATRKKRSAAVANSGCGQEETLGSVTMRRRRSRRGTRNAFASAAASAPRGALPPPLLLLLLLGKMVRAAADTASVGTDATTST